VRTAVIDIGSNSTRLLIADVDVGSGEVVDLERSSVVTRLGHGVDSTGELSDDAIERVMATLESYVEAIARHDCRANLAVMTSATRDASNGEEFRERVRALGLDARVLTGDEEAELMFLGAMSDGQRGSEETVVIDVGGGSTEFVIGHDGIATFHVSLQAGVVRMSERHIDTDPPSPSELQALAHDVRGTFDAGLPSEWRRRVGKGIAVAGTATSAAAIDMELDPYDPERVHGYPLQLATIELLLARLADMDEAARRRVVGLHPDRAPTIVAGMILLEEALKSFGLDEVSVSEHDILRGAAIAYSPS